MAPAQKRSMEDDFVFTISDNEDIGPEEDELAATPAPPKKKVKTSKKNKARCNNSEDEDEGAHEGVWGKNDDDDDAMASDFEFLQGDIEELNENEFSGWDFDGAKKSMKNESKGVDLDGIIRRRLAKKAAENSFKLVNDKPEASDDNEEELDINLDDDEDGVLADDAFGMEAKSEDEEEDNDKDKEEKFDKEGNDNGDEDEDENDDTDSVATAVEHPDDIGSDEEKEDTETDVEEAAKAAAFFAPEEPAEFGPKTVNTSFHSMSLSRPILRGLAAVGFTKPTPIQNKTIPIALLGKDVVGGAVTGSGKTGAFIVPILERLLYRLKKVPTSRVVVLTPTRELAIQCYAVATKLAAYTDIKFTLAVGGLSLKAQEAELRLRPDVIIATPGRFIDHMRNSASFAVDTVEILVLDEADRMLEDGFADELNEILTTLPKSRQTMLFSATMTSSVDSLVRVGMNKPVRLQVDTQNKTAIGLTQEFVRLRPGREEKRMGYLLYLCKEVFHERVIVFFRQKRDAHRTRIIFGLMDLSAAELHGSMNQTMRISSVEDFRDGKVSFLLATDLASRGLDIKGVDIVINYEAPQKPEIYVHRVGRTARAGRRGTSCTLAAEPDRKVVKAAVKTAKAQGAKIVSRVIDVAAADKYQAQVDAWADEITEIEKEEKLEKDIANVEMQVKKGENILKHEDEIKARPKRTWFESAEDKKKAKEVGRIELNGMREALKKKHDGVRLSNKDKKKLDSKADREKTRSWKKGKAERMGQGSVLNLKKPKNKVAKKASVKGKVKPKKGSRR